MYNLDAKKEQEINKIVATLQQLDLTDINLLNRDASTLLARKNRAELESQQPGPRKAS